MERVPALLIPAAERLLDRGPGAEHALDVRVIGVLYLERIVAGGMAEPASMGTGTGINFQSIGGGRAAVTGDFVLLGSEVDPVMRELRSHGIEVTALHSHMIGEQPTIYFMHFWGVGPAPAVATGLRAALDRTNVQR